MCPPWAPWTCLCPCWRWAALAGLSSSHIPYPASLWLHRARSVWCRMTVVYCTLTASSHLSVSSAHPQLPHGLPPASLSLQTEVEKQFLQDPSWLPLHDTDFAFQKFLKCVFSVHSFNIIILLSITQNIYQYALIFPLLTVASMNCAKTVI